jgi:hypothetical protein
MTQRGGNQSQRGGVSAAVNRNPRLCAVATLLAALLLVGCGSAVASPTPAPTTSPSPTVEPSPSPPPATSVGSPAQAAAIVFAHEGIGRMAPLQADVIGQSAWYEASEETPGYAVMVTVGAGDCQAGCIERHSWRYHVDIDGTVTLVSEEGDNIGLPPADGTGDPFLLRVRLVAGPVCPVVQNPPDPACAPRPVGGVEVLVFNAYGQHVGEAVSDERGLITMQLPSGAYYVVPAPVEGLTGTAAAQAFAAVGGDQVNLVLSYDTGIR